MNPYLLTGITMCLIVAVALTATAYLAVLFNRRAKSDLAAALGPLAALIGGEPEIDEARVKGRYQGHIAVGRMANAEEGLGRVFQTEVIDAAGGSPWRLTAVPASGPDRRADRRFASRDAALEERLGVRDGGALAALLDGIEGRFRLEYDPAAGHLRLTRPMRTRRDIPDASTFERTLAMLVAAGTVNRRAQEAPGAEETASGDSSSRGITPPATPPPDAARREGDR